MGVEGRMYGGRWSIRVGVQSVPVWEYMVIRVDVQGVLVWVYKVCRCVRMKAYLRAYMMYSYGRTGRMYGRTWNMCVGVQGVSMWAYVGVCGRTIRLRLYIRCVITDHPWSTDRTEPTVQYVLCSSSVF